MDESVSEDPLTLSGRFIDLFDPQLNAVDHKTLLPDERALLVDLDWLQDHGPAAKVVAAAGRVRGESLEEGAFSFHMRGPKGTTARAAVLLPRAPQSVSAPGGVQCEWHWNEASSTVHLEFPHRAEDTPIRITF